MDHSDATNVVKRPQSANVYRVSWVGYINSMLPYAVILGFLCAFLWFAPQMMGEWSYYIAGAVAAVWLVGLVYRFACIRAIKLFTTETGVWLSRGVFPWQKATSGVRWEEAGEAVAMTGVIAWATSAYHVGVMHRYTKKTELWATRIARGNEFVRHVNGVIHEYSARAVHPGQREL